ncbi:hypothetical protein N44_03233 [Microcystis aeruginosa NIES-44]|uniref:Uncharacterized protein n=1 Tax=Microcystis aeruginosa NIES-44 TaxID=449439 RepID=A0A0A1VYR6_MICAE|nr:hypothetical protein N44_03233 [Microcystis aeruginosa NIES-44]
MFNLSQSLYYGLLPHLNKQFKCAGSLLEWDDEVRVFAAIGWIKHSKTIIPH